MAIHEGVPSYCPELAGAVAAASRISSETPHNPFDRLLGRMTCDVLLRTMLNRDLTSTVSWVQGIHVGGWKSNNQCPALIHAVAPSVEVGTAGCRVGAALPIQILVRRATIILEIINQSTTEATRNRGRLDVVFRGQSRASGLLR